MTSIAREWEVWIAQNLLRGAPAGEIVATLRSQGMEEREIAGAIERVRTSPIFEAARPFARDARRAAIQGRMRRAMAARGSGIARRSGVSAAELHDVYVAHNVPVILTDVVTAWPGFGRWTPASLRDRFGDAEIDVTVGRESDPDYDRNAAKLTTRMTLRALVDRIEAGPSNDVYLIARGRALETGALSALIDEIAMPEGWLAMERARGSAQLWLGPEGTVTPLHHDTSNILFCQVYGRKRWRLIAPHETAMLDLARSLYSRLDPETDDLDEVRVHDFVLEPGEALFVPLGWWHHVRALDASISVALNCFTFPNAFDWYRPGEV